VPAVLNTSLNGRNEPIVMRPPEALRLLYTTPLDALAIGPFLVTK
jgi:carbamoyltransferase